MNGYHQIQEFPVTVTGKAINEIEVTGAKFVEVLQVGLSECGAPTAWAIVELTETAERSLEKDFAVIHIYKTGFEMAGNSGELQYLNSFEYDGETWCHAFLEVL